MEKASSRAWMNCECECVNALQVLFEKKKAAGGCLSDKTLFFLAPQLRGCTLGDVTYLLVFGCKGDIITNHKDKHEERICGSMLE